jgi:2-methylcitrate dehydratase PrpD
MPLVTMVPHPDLADIPEDSNAASAARVSVIYRDGASASVEVRYPSGAPENPLSGDELRAKFRDCAEGVIPEKNAERATDLLLALRSQPAVDEILSLLVR